MGLSRRTKDKLNPSRVFFWSGNPIPAKSGKNQRLTNKYYSGFELDGMKIQVGDCVCVSASATLSMLDYYVGRIVECYDNGEEIDPHRANIKWYSEIEEIPKHHLKEFLKDYPDFDSTIELFKDLTPFANDTDIDSIVATCQVTEVEASVAPSDVKRPVGLTGHFFVCRFHYQRKKPWILPIVEISQDLKLLRSLFEAGFTKEIRIPIEKIKENQENIPMKTARRKTRTQDEIKSSNVIKTDKENISTAAVRRRTRLLDDASILEEIVEEKTAKIKQPLQESTRQNAKRKDTPLKPKLSMVEPRTATINGIAASPRKATPASPRKATPVSARKATPVKRAKRRSVAASSVFDLPKRETPIQGKGTCFEVARTQLHVSTVPDCLPCRGDEFHHIYSFVEGKLLDSIGGCLYVSGVPGTGKTATVTEVTNLLKEAQLDGSLPAFDLLHINAMKLTKPHQLWVQMWKEISGEKATCEHAAKLLAKHVTKSSTKSKCIVLILDELDLLWTKKQDVMYNIFDWSSQVGSKLVVVAIANTMDLPERMMISRVSSRLGLTRMTFQPYTFNQLQEIITARLTGLNAFEPDAIQFVSRKVAALSGDARRALDICRRATEIAEHAKPTKKKKNSPTKSSKVRPEVVGLDHVSKAIEEMFSSSMIKAIGRCSSVEKILLQCIIAEFSRTGLEEAVFEKVLGQIESTCRFEGKRPPTSSQVLALLQSLSSQRIVLAEHSRLDLMLRIRLNVSIDDINYAIQEKLTRT